MNRRPMDREKLKLIVKNMKSLVDCLEAEVYSDPNAYVWTTPKEKRLEKQRRE